MRLPPSREFALAVPRTGCPSAQDSLKPAWRPFSSTSSIHSVFQARILRALGTHTPPASARLAGRAARRRYSAWASALQSRTILGGRHMAVGDWESEDTYWQSNYKNRPYAKSGDYASYRGGY